MNLYIKDLLKNRFSRIKSSPLSDKINNSLIKQAFHDSYDTMLSAIFFTFLIYFCLLFFDHDTYLHIWVVGCVVYYLARIFLIYVYKKKSFISIKIKSDQISSRAIVFIATLTAFSLLSLAYIVSRPSYPIESHIGVGLAIIMFSAGAIMSYSLVPKWILTFLISLYSPLAIWFVLQWEDSPIYPLLSVSIIFYVIYLSFVSYAYYKIHYNSLSLHLENEKFIEQTIESKEKLQTTNRYLSIANADLLNEIKHRKEIENQLNEINSIDILTGLTNRQTLMQSIKDAIRNSTNKHYFAIIFIDLDRFKFINDTLGHQVGDEFLKAISQRILNCTKKVDTIARIGGDEFIALINNIREKKHIITVAQKILHELSQPYVIDNHPLASSASMGVSIYPSCGEDADTLIRNADTAMYRAKKQGGNSFFFYTEELNEGVQRKIEIEKKLREAQREKQFYLLYQPIVHAKTEQIVGIEALMRICNNDENPISPTEFIPIAEENGMICSMGLWALKEVCYTLNKWQKLNLPPIKISINVSIKQIISSNFIDDFKEIINKSHADPSYLEIEVTESMAVEHHEYIIKILNQLIELGMTIIIDDFGTGHSSLNYLKELPAKKLKIDGSYIHNIANDKDNKKIVNAIISLSKTFNLTVIAEGVETKEEFDYLVKQKCDLIQGFYFSKPVTLETLMIYFQQNIDNASKIQNIPHIVK